MKKSMRLFVIVVVIILILVFMLFALISLKNIKSSTKTEHNSSNTHQVKLSLNEAVKKIPKVYNEDVDFQKCVVQEIETCLSDSIREKMKKDNSVELCDDYITKSMKKNCKINFAFKKAMHSGNLSDCNMIENEKTKDSCILELNYMTAVKANSLDACQGLTEDLKVKCVSKSVTKIAQNLKDVSWCDKLQDDEVDKKVCKQEVNDLIKEEKRLNQKEENSSEKKEQDQDESVHVESEDKK